MRDLLVLVLRQVSDYKLVQRRLNTVGNVIRIADLRRFFDLTEAADQQFARRDLAEIVQIEVRIARRVRP